MNSFNEQYAVSLKGKHLTNSGGMGCCNERLNTTRITLVSSIKNKAVNKIFGVPQRKEKITWAIKSIERSEYKRASAALKGRSKLYLK